MPELSLLPECTVPLERCEQAQAALDLHLAQDSLPKLGWLWSHAGGQGRHSTPAQGCGVILEQVCAV